MFGACCLLCLCAGACWVLLSVGVRCLLLVYIVCFGVVRCVSFVDYSEMYVVRCFAFVDLVCSLICVLVGVYCLMVDGLRCVLSVVVRC